MFLRGFLGGGEIAYGDICLGACDAMVITTLGVGVGVGEACVIGGGSWLYDPCDTCDTCGPCGPIGILKPGGGG